MKLLLCGLLLVLLCTTQVQALRCYTCDGDSTCKAETDSLQDGEPNTFSRTCEEFCGDSFSASCCTEDLC